MHQGDRSKAPFSTNLRDRNQIMQNDNELKPSTTTETPTLKKRIGAIGLLVLATSLLAGCYIGPAGYGHGGGGWHHDGGYGHYR
jgi:hypothetical protein